MGGALGQDRRGRQTDDPGFLSHNVVVHKTGKPRCRCLWYVNFCNHHFRAVWLMISATDKPADVVFLTENIVGETLTVSFIKQKETRTTRSKGQMNSKRTTEKLARGGL